VATKQQQVMGNQREKIINAILDCRISPVEYREMEHLAKLYTDDLVDVLINELYELHQALEDNITKANVENQKLLDIIEHGNTFQRNN
jgi:hypothetical protein